MKAQIAIVLLTKLLAVTAEDAKGQGTFALVHLGSVDGKIYFYDREVSRNWFEARAFCSESGMKLASIEKPSQAAFLKSQYNSTSFTSFFWTAGRDAQIPRQFTWDNTGTAPTDLIDIGWAAYGGSLDYQTCVYYHSQPTPQFILRSCSEGSGFTLCEMLF